MMNRTLRSNVCMGRYLSLSDLQSLYKVPSRVCYLHSSRNVWKETSVVDGGVVLKKKSTSDVVENNKDDSDESIIDYTLRKQDGLSSREARLSSEVLVGRRDKTLITMPRSLAKTIESDIVQFKHRKTLEDSYVSEQESKLQHINSKIKKLNNENIVRNSKNYSDDIEPFSLPKIKKRDLIDLAFEINRRYLPDIEDSENEAKAARRKIVKDFGINNPHLRQELMSNKNTLPLLYDERLTSAYVTGMSSLSFSAISNAMLEITRRDPLFEPNSVLDFGCGPGTALWASNIYFGNTLEKYTGVDISIPMLKSCERICKEEFGIENLSLKRYLNLLLTKEEDRHDLVTCNFVLGEIPKEMNRLKIARALWEHTGDTLVLVDRANKKGFQSLLRIRSMILDLENGTNTFDESHFTSSDDHVFKQLFPNKTRSHGFEIDEKLSHLHKKAIKKQEDTSREALLKKLRDDDKLAVESGQSEILNSNQSNDAIVTQDNCMLASGDKIKTGAYVFAPCPHEFKCPMAQRGLCSNMQMYERPHYEMELKRSKNNHTFAHFSYLIIRRGKRPERDDKLISRTFHWPRLVEMPLKRKQHVVFTWCSPNGKLEKTSISKSKMTSQQYRDARKSSLFDIWPHKPVNKVVDVNELRARVGDGIDNGKLQLRSAVHGQVEKNNKNLTIHSTLHLSDENLSEMDLSMKQDVEDLREDSEDDDLSSGR